MADKRTKSTGTIIKVYKCTYLCISSLRQTYIRLYMSSGSYPPCYYTCQRPLHKYPYQLCIRWYLEWYI